VQGDAKSLVQVWAGSRLLTVVAQNDDSVKTFAFTHELHLREIMPDKNEVTAVMTLKNGKTNRKEMGYGTTYLSQSTRRIIITPQVRKVDLFDYTGALTRSLSF
jgi:hypothetical protein